jgi:hypothetical protein
MMTPVIMTTMLREIMAVFALVEFGRKSFSKGFFLLLGFESFMVTNGKVVVVKLKVRMKFILLRKEMFL